MMAEFKKITEIQIENQCLGDKKPIKRKTESIDEKESSEEDGELLILKGPHGEKKEKKSKKKRKNQRKNLEKCERKQHLCKSTSKFR